MFHRRILERFSLAARDDRAAQLAEFAITLPLLVCFVVGIFDFSSAFTLKQKLTNVARDAARDAAGDPSNDLSSPNLSIPASVLDAFQVVDNYFIANNLNDCGVTATGSPTGLTWTFSSNKNGCTPPGLTIIINRGYYFPASQTPTPSATCVSQAPGGTNTPVIVATCVSIQYAYPWRFGRVASLLGRTDTLPNQITGTGVALNEN